MDGPTRSTESGGSSGESATSIAGGSGGTSLPGRGGAAGTAGTSPRDAAPAPLCREVVHNPTTPVLAATLPHAVFLGIPVESGLVLETKWDPLDDCSSLVHWPYGGSALAPLTDCFTYPYPRFAFGSYGFWLYLDGRLEYRLINAQSAVVTRQLEVGALAAGPRGLLYWEPSLQQLSLLTGPGATPTRIAEMPTWDHHAPIISASSPQAAWTYGKRIEGVRHQLSRVDYDGGSPVTVTETVENPRFHDLRGIPGYSFDGVYAFASDYLPEPKLIHWSAAGTGRELGRGIRWYTLDDQFIYWIDETSIWQQNHCGGPKALVATLPEEPIEIAIREGVLWLFTPGETTSIYQVDVRSN